LRANPSELQYAAVVLAHPIAAINHQHAFGNILQDALVKLTEIGQVDAALFGQAQIVLGVTSQPVRKPGHGK